MMRRSARLAAIYIALAAMMLRALLPIGWMPNTAGAQGTPIMLCTIDGPVHILIGSNGQPIKQKPAPADGHHHDVCPFGAAPHFATPVPALALAAPTAAAHFANFAVEPNIIGGAQRYSQQAPRAPPSLV